MYRTGTRTKRVGFLTTGVLLAVVLLVGCDQSGAGGPPSSLERERIIVDPPAVPPSYSIDPEVEAEHPAIADFVREFLTTCLNGDYTGYTKLVSRLRRPESVERFTAMYHAIKSATVESIRPVEHRELPKPAYLVVSRVEVREDVKHAARGQRRGIAIIVVSEDGAWRMLPAPTALQPAKEDEEPDEPGDAAEKPEADTPDYPWDEDDDG